jgi:phosphoenolpyruvate carboxykinase (ATP)
MTDHHSRAGLEDIGLDKVNTVWRNLPPSALYEHAITRKEGIVAWHGPLVVRTGQHTARAPNDKFIVRESSSADKIWWGDINQPFAPEQFEQVLRRMRAYLQGKDIYVQDCFAGTDPTYRVPIQVITELSWHNLFAWNMFVRPTPEEQANHKPQFTVLAVPGFTTEPEIDGTRGHVCILLNFARRLVLIGGTHYGGEIKKSVFTLLNYLLPQQDVLAMHASVNVGEREDPAVFFGLSGTGKTTLSSDPSRRLIGDDEHGWSDRGLFNFEGGCYAKTIDLSEEDEPEIYRASQQFGTILENVAVDPVTRKVDFADDTFTQNTRASYPIMHVPNADLQGQCGHPRTILMLTADAFGVLPPISRLTPDQAMYQFLLGYTAKVGGTEKGVDEPRATFSPCFGAPFMVLPPTTYATMLGERIAQYNVTPWLVNTGWTGGPYGTGHRIKLAYTRAMINAALSGELAAVETTTDPVFGLHVPTHCPNVPSELLQPRETWEDKAAYDRQANEVASLFVEHFQPFAEQVPQSVCDAGPRLTGAD